MKSKLFLSVLLLAVLQHYVNSDGRIYGGYPVDITKAPYMVSIVVALEAVTGGAISTYDCGGTILRRNLILTAAHCNINGTIDNHYNPASYYVNVGTNYKDLTGGTIHSVKTVFVHPKYKGGGDNHYFHDVGLLELTDYIVLNERSQLVNLAHKDDNPENGTDGTVTGYGDNPDHPNDRRLYQVHLSVITGEQCVNELAGGTAEEVDEHQICAEAEGKNFCQGDSGGSFHDVATNRQVGIVSYGAKNCTIAKPSIFCRVTDNLDFINEVIRNTTRATRPTLPQTVSTGSVINMFRPSSLPFLPRS